LPGIFDVWNVNELGVSISSTKKEPLYELM